MRNRVHLSSLLLGRIHKSLRLMGVGGGGEGGGLDILSGDRLGLLTGVRCCAEKVKNRNPLRFSIDLEVSGYWGTPRCIFAHADLLLPIARGGA